jgi:hypothetical protein
MVVLPYRLRPAAIRNRIVGIGEPVKRDVLVGSIGLRTGNPTESDHGNGVAAFPRPGDCTSGTAETFASAGAFLAAWAVVLR